MGANIIETTPTNQNKRKRSPGLKSYSNKKKFKYNCHNYEKDGYKSTDYHTTKNNKKWVKKTYLKRF